MLLTKKLNGMTTKERSNINIYLIEAIDVKNHLKVFGKDMVNKTFRNIFLNELPQSYKIVIQSITYIIQPIFEDVTKIYYIVVRKQKLGQ